LRLLANQRSGHTFGALNEVIAETALHAQIAVIHRTIKW
jgi:hypothetical protein